VKYKTLPAALKAPPVHVPDAPGFEAIVSVFNNKDLVGDIVRPGAFKDSLAAWQESGDPIPVLWSHRMDSPEFNIGAVTDIDEVGPGDPRIPESASKWIHENGGLWVKADLDTAGSPLAAQVHNLLLKRRVTQFSFAYDVLDEKTTPAGNELLKLWLHEVSTTPIGANPLTELVGAKSTPEPVAPRPPSAADIRLRCAIRLAAIAN